MRNHNCSSHPQPRDYGCEPFVCNLPNVARRNECFRAAIWTGRYLQLTLMSIPVGGDIGVEMHGDVDQLLRVESGRARVLTGACRNDLRESTMVGEGCAILIPEGTWHNVVNVGNRPLKLSSLYAPPQHPAGTVHLTKEDAAH